MNRRAFLQTVAASAVGFALDPVRLIYLPGAHTLVLPETEIVKASSLAEAVSRGLRAKWPDGTTLELVFTDDPVRLRRYGFRDLDDAVNREIQAIRESGGRVVPNRQWREVTL